MNYAALHAGDGPPTPYPINICVFAGRASSVGRIDAISYATRRGLKAAIWRHEFRRRPALLQADPEGSVSLGGTVPELIGLGLVIDLEMEDGRRIVASGVYIATDPDDGSLWLVSEHPIGWALQPIPGVSITPRGIEG